MENAMMPTLQDVAVVLAVIFIVAAIGILLSIPIAR
jgi:hypothetical protein